MSKPKAAAAAFVLSLGIYATPLVGPHAAFLLGERVLSEVESALGGRGDQALTWIATDLGVALVAQLAFFALFFWFLRQPGWLRGACVAVPIIPTIVGLNLAYMVAIPTHFLIEADTADERNAWPVECAAPRVWVPDLATPPSVVRSAQLWVAEVDPPNRYALLDPAGCALTPLALAFSSRSSVAYLAGDHVLQVTTDPPTGRQSWEVIDTVSGAKMPIEVEQGERPILSTDGTSVAWLRPVAGTIPPLQLEAVVRGIDGGRARVVPLTALERGGSQQILQLDSAAGELVLVRGLSELYWLGMDGRVRKRQAKPEGVEPQPQTYRFLSGGWVAWDAYRDREPYRIVWSLPGGHGNRELPKGRGVTSLALSPDGVWIAMSLTSSLSIGSTPDVVAVFRVADGVEAFRRYLPKYTRASVAFPDPGRFVYSDIDGVTVLKIQ